MGRAIEKGRQEQAREIGVSVYYADIRQSGGALQTIEIMADTLDEALQKANAEYGIEAVHGVSDTLAFGWKGKPAS